MPETNPNDWLQRFLAAHPRYREYVTWSEQHQGYALPAWLGDILRVWILEQTRPGASQLN